ncbi:TPA: lipid II flippase MurJ, partial [Klebsiella pneumoniae]
MIKKMFLPLFTGGLLGKFAGVFRELLMAWCFGTGPETSSFRITQTVLLSPINLFSSDIISGGLIPKYRALVDNDNVSAKSLFGAVLVINITLALVLTLFFLFFSTDITHFFLSEGENYFDVLHSFIYGAAFSVIPYVYSNICSSILVVHKELSPFSHRASIQAVFLSIGILLSFYLKDYNYFVYAFPLSYIFMSIWITFILVKINAIPKFDNVLITILNFFNSVKFLLLVPALYQIYWLVEKHIGSQISLTMISTYEYAKFYTETFISLISVPLGYAILASSHDETIKARKTILYYNFFVLFVSYVLFFLGWFFIKLVYQHGSFTSTDTSHVYEQLKILSLSLFFQANFYLNLKILSVKGRYSIIFLSVFLSVSSGMLSLFFLRDMLGVYIVAVSFFILNFVGSMTLMMIERNFERHMLFVFLGV